MTDIDQVSDDLKFVREAVGRRDIAVRTPPGILYIWAAYVLIGYILIDFAPRYSGLFFAVGGAVGGMLSGVIARRETQRTGEINTQIASRARLHWMLGFLLALLVPIALAATSPVFQGLASGQLIAINFGIVYFFWGIHYERQFLWLGALLIVGGIVVRFIPNYPWSCLGVVVAAGLVISTFFRAKQS